MSIWDDSEHPDTSTVRELRAENERLRAALTDAINSMERGGFNVDLQFYLRRALGQHAREDGK